MRGRVGVIVNPVAGIGGAVGLKGSDGAAIQHRARDRGGRPMSSERAAIALRVLAESGVPVLTAGAAMGEALARSVGLVAEVVMTPAGAVTSGRDSTRAAAALVTAGAELILFAGGDGTARDVMAGAGRVAILGVPGGVKMYSGVFAATPALAGRLAARFIATEPARRRTEEAEVVDVDEARLRRDEPGMRLHGTVVIPASPAVGRAKATGSGGDEAELSALCHGLAASTEPGCLTIVGPGRTMRAFMAAQGLPKTLLGVDLCRGGQLIARDCGERQILEAMDGGPSRVVIGLLGGQGCLFGRGNQPISGRVLRRVGLDRILVLAGAGKLATLPRGIFADTGDDALDRDLQGFMRVHTGPRRTSLVRVRAGGALDLA